MHPKPTTALHHLGADLDQTTANRAGLSVLQLGPVKVLFQRSQENISRRAAAGGTGWRLNEGGVLKELCRKDAYLGLLKETIGVILI